MATDEPPIYDVESALRQMDHARFLVNDIVTAQAGIGDELAKHMARHFDAATLEAAGVALVIAAASMGALVDSGVPPSTLPNVLGFTGQRMVNQARAGKEV